MHRPFAQKVAFSFGELLCYGMGGASGKIAGTTGTAEDAAAGADLSIPVGTGHAAVQCNLINFLTEPIPEFKVQ